MRDLFWLDILVAQKGWFKKQATSPNTSFVILILVQLDRKAQLFSAPIHETFPSVFLLTWPPLHLMAAWAHVIGFLVCKLCFWIDATVTTWPFFCCLWKVNKDYTRSHFFTVPKTNNISTDPVSKSKQSNSSQCSVRTAQPQVRTQRFSMAEVLAWLPVI